MRPSGGHRVPVCSTPVRQRKVEGKGQYLMRLAGKVALVTGAQQGIGKAIALAYGRAGASVVVNYLDDQAAAEAIATQILCTWTRGRARGWGCITPSRCAAYGRGWHRTRSIDIVVNNAGIFPRVEFLDMTEAQWVDVLNVNLKGTFFCSQAVAR